MKNIFTLVQNVHSDNIKTILLILIFPIKQYQQNPNQEVVVPSNKNVGKNLISI